MADRFFLHAFTRRDDASGRPMIEMEAATSYHDAMARLDEWGGNAAWSYDHTLVYDDDGVRREDWRDDLEIWRAGRAASERLERRHEATLAAGWRQA